MSVPDLSRQLGRYKLVRLLGEGNMGKVYRAVDTRLERDVALKIPSFSPNDESAIKRFHREAHAAAVVNHPNICPVYDVEEINSIHFLTMPLLEGELLSNLVGPGKLWDMRKAAELIKTLALAMDEMHKKGLMHRDLKPANIMVRTRDKVPIIMDMGLARSYLTDLEMITVQGQKIGTPAYMSPEQVRGDVHMTHSCDIYSLGIILYQLLTGKVPFVGKPGHIYTHILNTPADPPSTLRPEIPKALDAICLRTLQKNPEDRFGTMAEFAQYLEQFLQASAPRDGGGDGRGNRDLEAKLQQALQMLQQRNDQLTALTQAATAKGERLLVLEQQYRTLEHQAQSAQSEVDMTRKMWATAERKYQEQLNALNGRLQQVQQQGTGPSEEARRQIEKVQEQLRTKESEIEMLKNFWQATERQYQFKMEDMTRQMRQAQEDLVMVRQGQGRDAAWKQKHDALERELQSLKTQQQGQVEQLTLAAEQVRTELELERQAKNSFEERLGALQSESVMVKRLWEHRERQLADDLTRAQEDVRRLSQQQTIPPEKLLDAERRAQEAQEQLQQEQQQRATAETQRKELAERLAQVESRLQTSASEAEMIKRMWSATEKNYQEQLARLQEDLLRAQKAPTADKERFEKLSQQLMEAQAQLAHNEETLHLLQDEQAAALERLEGKTKELLAAKEAAAQEQQRREVLEKNLAARDVAVREAQAQSEAAAKAQAEEEQERARREQRLHDLEAQLAQAQADHQSWQERLETARAREDELRQKLQASTEAAGQVTALQQRLRVMQEELAQEQEFRRQAEEEMIRIATASHAEGSAKEKVTELEARLTEENRLRDELQEQLDKLRHDLENFRAAASQEQSQVADLEAKLAEERRQRADLEEQAERLRTDLRSEQESVDALIQLERARVRELEDEYQQTRQRLEQELAQARVQQAEPAPQAAPGIDPQLLAEAEEQVQAAEEKVRTLEAQLQQVEGRLGRTQELETQLHSLEEELARQQAQQAAIERAAQEAQARAEELQGRLDAAAKAAPAEGGGQAEERLRQVQHLWEQEKELRQEAEDRAREAIDVAADLRRRMKYTEEELNRERTQSAVPDTRARELEKQLLEVREKLMAADYGQKDAEMKLGFLQRRMDTVDQMAADDTRRRVEAERRQREAEAALDEERRLRQAADRRLQDLNDRVQQASMQMDQAARSASSEKHSRVLAEQEVMRLRSLLESQHAGPGTPPAGVPAPPPKSGPVKRPPTEILKAPRKNAPPPLPTGDGSGDDGPTVEMKVFPLPDRPTPASGVHNVRGSTARPTPEGTGYPRIQVELRGSWYCRPMDDPAAKWSKVAETPAQVQIKPGEIYFLKVANAVTDAELVLLNSLRQVPTLHTLSLSGCPEVSDHGLIHLRTLGQLQALNIASTPGITDAGLAYLRGLSRLTILSLASCAGITDAGLVPVGQLSHLQTLYLTGCPQITDMGISHLRLLNSLHTLYLDGCTQITDAALEVIGLLQNLHTLNLDRCSRLTDRGLSHLRRLTNLATLSLDRCEQITDAGLLHLRDLENLQSLSLTYCPRITQAGLNHLQHLTKLQTVSFVSGPGQRPTKVS